MSLALQPTGSWIEWVVQAGTPDTTFLLAPRPWADPASYYGGQKIRGLVRIGDVLRSLSDRSGAPIVSTFDCDVFDKSGELRDLLEAVTYLISSDLTFYLASDHAHDVAVLADPRVGFRGQVVRAAPTPSRMFALSCESRMGTRFGPFDYDSPVLKRKFDTTDFPNLPRENQGLAVPFGWGEWSDEGTVTASPGPTTATPGTLSPLAASHGMIIPIGVGYLPGGTPGGPQHLLPPTNFQVTVFGSGPTKPVRLAVTFYNTSGETTPAILTVSNYPSHPGPFPGTPTDYAVWTWDDPNATPVGHGIVYLDDFDGSGWHHLDGAYLTYTDDGDDSHNKNPGQGPPAVNGAVIGTTPASKRFYVISANPGKIISIYHSDLGNPPSYVAMTASEIGTYFDLGPNDEGYVYTSAGGRDYFGFLAQGPYADAHDAGTMPFRVNYCGWHDTAGTPDLLIDQLALIYQDVIVQLQGNNGLGWQGGARLTIPSFGSSPTVPILQSTTFQAVQAQTAAEMGNTPGLGALGAVYLNSLDTTWREFITGMNRTLQSDSGENHHGQFIIAMIPAAVTPTDGLIVREFIDVRQVLDAGEPQRDEIEGSINYQFDRSPADGVFRSGLIPLQDPVSITGYQYRQQPTSLDLVYTRDPATATWAANKYLTLRAIAPRYVTVTAKFRKALAIELGEQFRVEHSDLGLGIFVLYCKHQRASVERGEVELRGRLLLVDPNGTPP